MFDLCAHTVGTYINKYKSNGLYALVPAPKSGAPKFLTPEQEAKLKEVITLNTPDNVGFPNRKNWNASLAIQWLYNNYGIKYSNSGMLKVLYRLGLSFTKPTYTFAKADPQKQEEFKASFEDLWGRLKFEIINNVFYKSLNQILVAVRGFIRMINRNTENIINRLYLRM